MPSGTLTLTVDTAIGWTNPNNSIGSNNAYSTYTDTGSPGTNYYFRYNTNASTFAGVAGAGAVIVGVVMTDEYKASTVTPQPRVSAGPKEFGGPNEGDVFVTTTDVIYTFGSPTNPLGASTFADLNTVSLRVGKNATGTVTYSVDHVTCTIYWELGTTSTKTLFFGELF